MISDYKDAFINKLIKVSLSSKISWKRLTNEIIKPYFFENEFHTINYALSFYSIIDNVFIFLLSIKNESAMYGNVSDDVELLILPQGSQELQLIDTNSSLLYQLSNAIKYCLKRTNNESEAIAFIKNFLIKY